ncbi:hypothetical protein BSKO_00432 [Bryopsis sp. KO-2023]|nr:hypothetical protein BSKO_00432 [Bryopsis sp. KO-2023]
MSRHPLPIFSQPGETIFSPADFSPAAPQVVSTTVGALAPSVPMPMEAYDLLHARHAMDHCHWMSSNRTPNLGMGYRNVPESLLHSMRVLSNDPAAGVGAPLSYVPVALTHPVKYVGLTNLNSPVGVPQRPTNQMPGPDHSVDPRFSLMGLQQQFNQQPPPQVPTLPSMGNLPGAGMMDWGRSNNGGAVFPMQASMVNRPPGRVGDVGVCGEERFMKRDVVGFKSGLVGRIGPSSPSQINLTASESLTFDAPQVKPLTPVTLKEAGRNFPRLRIVDDRPNADVSAARSIVDSLECQEESVASPSGLDGLDRVFGRLEDISFGRNSLGLMPPVPAPVPCQKQKEKSEKKKAVEVPKSATGVKAATEAKILGKRKSGGGSVESAFRRPGQTKSGSKLKAVAKPEGPGGVEDCFGGDVQITVPTDLFKLKDLHSVLNLETWNESLEDGERDFLRQFLPKDIDESSGGTLDKLLRGEDNFHFGNPVGRMWELMVEGEYHPRVVKYREGLRCLHHAEHFHSVRDYHNRMVSQLQEMAQIFDQKEGSVSEKIEFYRSTAAAHGGVPSTGGGAEKAKRKRKKPASEATGKPNAPSPLD